MTRDEINKEQENFEKYKDALKLVYADGSVSSSERNRLIALKNELGLSDSDCKNLESPFKMIEQKSQNNEKTSFEDLCKCHHAHCFDNDGAIRWEGINHSSLEYLDIGETYIEMSSASYTGINENFALSIGQSFEDLFDEYGEDNIYDAVKDGKLQVFDNSCNIADIESWLAMKFNILDMEGMQREYLEPLNEKNIVEYAVSLQKDGYVFGDYDVGIGSGAMDADFNILQEIINNDDDMIVNVLKTPFAARENIGIVVKDVSHTRDSDDFESVAALTIGRYLSENKKFIAERSKDLWLILEEKDGFLDGLVTGLEQGPQETYFLPIDIDYKINIPQEVFNHFYSKGENCFAVVSDKISQHFLEESKLNGMLTETSKQNIKCELSLRHQFAVMRDVNYKNFPFKETDAILTNQLGLALNELVPEELKEKGLKITFDEISPKVPSVFYLNDGRDRVEATPEKFEYFRQSDEEFVNSLSLESVRTAHSTVTRELENFRADKAKFNEVLENNPKLKDYLEFAIKDPKELTLGEGLQQAEIRQNPSENMRLYLRDKETGQFLQLENERETISWNYEHYDGQMNLVDSDIWHNDYGIDLDKVVGEIAKECGLDVGNLGVIGRNDFENRRFENTIHSPEFIQKFGDWEKANRLEKLKNSESIIGVDKIEVEGVDLRDLVHSLRNNYSKENLKQLQNIARDIGRDVIEKLREAQNINFPNPPVLKNLDSGKTFKFQMTGINEIKNHDIFKKGHIEAIASIPEIVQKGIYISTEANEDGRKPQYTKFHYFGCGYVLDNEDYTAKIVFTETKDGELFYDQSLSSIEKGRLIDIIQEKNMLETRFEQNKVLNPLISQENLDDYDKRLVSICQVPQMPYLEQTKDGEWQPTKEAVEAVKNGTLYIEKQGQKYSMVDQSVVRPTEKTSSLKEFMRTKFGTDELYDKTLEAVRQVANKFVGDDGLYYSHADGKPYHFADERTALQKVAEYPEDFKLSLKNVITEITIDQTNNNYAKGLLSHSATASVNLGDAAREFFGETDTERAMPKMYSLCANENLQKIDRQMSASGWEQKYSPLSAEKLVSFINDNSFDAALSKTVLADFEGYGTPLVIDELGNVCERNIWEKDEQDAIVDYMPSGIMTKEIELVEDFLTSHELTADRRLATLKLRDALEEINDRLVEREGRVKETSRDKTERLKPEKEIVDDYLSKVKESLSELDASSFKTSDDIKNAVKSVLLASKKALSSFSKDEKEVIGRYLFDNGATDEKKLGTLLKKKVEPAHKREIKRNIDYERGR